MQLAFFLLAALSFGDCKVKSGIFDNVTVIVKSNSSSEKILIDFDDTLSKYLQHKRSQVVLIQGQFIPKLDSNSISDLPEVENLTVVHNGIREIRRGAFKNLPNLKILNLSHNALEDVHQSIFNDLPIEDLYLNDNKISRIGYKAFSHLNLRNLFLNNNRISRFGKDWFTDSSILVLDLSYNLIEELPQNAFQLMAPPTRGNISVFFTGNRLRKIDNNVFHDIENFQQISLDNNLIDRLSVGAFHGVKSVRILNLNNNSLVKIKSEVLKNIRVDVLNLEDNKLRCVSTEIFHMQELDIDGNPISCSCVQKWLNWRDVHSYPSIYHITNLEQECI